jgi:hypothetical protein
MENDLLNNVTNMYRPNYCVRSASGFELLFVEVLPTFWQILHCHLEGEYHGEEKAVAYIYISGRDEGK